MIFSYTDMVIMRTCVLGMKLASLLYGLEDIYTYADNTQYNTFNVNEIPINWCVLVHEFCKIANVAYEFSHPCGPRLLVRRVTCRLSAPSFLLVVTGRCLACAFASRIQLAVTMALLQAVFPSLDDVLHFAPWSFMCLLMRIFPYCSTSNAILHIT